MKNKLAGILIGTLITCWPTFPHSAEITLKFAHSYSRQSPAGFGASKLADLVNRQYGSRLKIQVFPEGQLARANELAPALSKGAFDLAAISTATAARLYPRMGVFEVPFLFEDMGAIARFQQGENGKTLLAEFGKKFAITGLDYWHGSMLVMSSKMPLLSPDNLKGMKVLTPFAPRVAEAFSALGAVPLTISFAEIFPQIQTGLADSLQATPQFISDAKIYSVATYLTKTQHAYLGYIIVGNAASLNKLPPEIRSGLTKILETVRIETNRYAVDEYVKSLSRIKDTNMKIVSLSESQIKVWKDELKPTWENYGKTIGRELIQAASGTGGGGDPCPDGQCRCKNRTCTKDCCIK